MAGTDNDAFYIPSVKDQVSSSLKPFRTEINDKMNDLENNLRNNIDSKIDKLRTNINTNMNTNTNNLENRLERSINRLGLITITILFVVVIFVVIFGVYFAAESKIMVLEMRNETREYINSSINASNKAIIDQMQSMKDEFITLNNSNWKKIEQRIFELEKDKKERGKRRNESAQEG